MTEERLPTVEPERAPPPPPPLQVESSSARLVGTLAVAGALAGLAIVLVFQWANPRIEAWRAEVLAQAVTTVLDGADRYEVAFLEADRLTRAPAGDTTELDRVYVGYDRIGAPVGIAVVGGEPGFQDVIRLIFGYDPPSGEVIGMRVLESKETPGLGDKIEKDSSFVAEFERVSLPLVGVRSGRETGSDAEVTTITGATISSQAIVDIINNRLDELRGAIDSYWSSAEVAASTRPPASSAGRAGGSR